MLQNEGYLDSRFEHNSMNNMFNNIDGHQYYLDEWRSGKIIINDSINATLERILFDMVSGEPIIG